MQLNLEKILSNVHDHKYFVVSHVYAVKAQL